MPASAPYIPPRDADFEVWLDNFADLIAANPTDYGLAAGDATTIDTVRDAFVSAYAAAVNPATSTPVTVAAKDVARVNAEDTVRPYAQEVRNNGAVSEALKVGLGLNLPPATLTPIPAPTSAPVMGVRSMTPGQAVLTFHDSVLTGKKKPYGATGVDLFVAYGTTPSVDPDEGAFMQTITKSPATILWPSTERGKIGTIFARYRTRSGPSGVALAGPWADPLPLTVT